MGPVDGQAALDSVRPGCPSHAGGALPRRPHHVSRHRPPDLRHLRGDSRAPSLCREGVFFRAPASRHHDDKQGDEPTGCPRRFPGRREQEHRFSHPHSHRLDHRSGTGSGAAAQRHQSHLGVFAGSPPRASRRNRSHHGTGNEHASHGRRSCAGADPVFACRTWHRHADPIQWLSPLPVFLQRVRFQPSPYAG